MIQASYWIKTYRCWFPTTYIITTNSTQEPTLLWTNGATLTGWGLKPEGEAATYPIAVMTQSTSAGSGDSAGVGTFHYDTNGDDLYIRTA